MNYLGHDIPKLGFGLMRLPMIEKEVDIEQTKTMVDMFLKAGFTYFDTAYGYIGGKSEEAVKPALVDRYPRESFQLATKLPAWAAKSAEEAKAMLDTSLQRTGAGYFDFYLLHNCGDNRTAKFDEYGLWDFVLEAKKEGKVKQTLMFASVINMFDVIVTDRLHVGICAEKLGKQVILLDNSYGKVSSVYEYSLKDFENVSVVSQSDLDSAVQKVAGTKENSVQIDKSYLLPVCFFDFVKVYGSIENEYGMEKRFWGK